MANNYRYELKFLISKGEAAVLKKQLALVCQKDPHSISSDVSYYIRSLYFDDIFNSGFDDKINGVQYRKKYRIRIYNSSKEYIKLECKHKDNDMTGKEEAHISLETAHHLINKEYSKIKDKDPLIDKFLLDARLFGLKPAVIVDYTRLAFTYPVSDVRITFDENIRSGRYSYELFNQKIQTQQVSDENYVEIEIKCNDFIPSHIQAILNSVDKCRIALSKFALACDIK